MMENIHGVKHVLVDEYKLFLNGIEYTTIFICPYGHNCSYAPQGMLLVDEASDNDRVPISAYATNTDTSSAKRQTPLFCGNCGMRLPGGEIKFCPKCGSRIQK